MRAGRAAEHGSEARKESDDVMETQRVRADEARAVEGADAGADNTGEGKVENNNNINTEKKG